MRRGGGEYDRLARLQRLIYILNQNPGGISPEELARQCGGYCKTNISRPQSLGTATECP